MARLGSIAKGGYYPIPENMSKLIRQHLKAEHSGRVHDPCCGNGVALDYFARELYMQPYGAELNTMRSSQATTAIDKLLANEYWRECTQLKDEGLTRIIRDDMVNTKTSKASMQLLYLNPPYDVSGERDSEGKRDRLEYKFLQKMTFFLQENGILVFVIPQRTIGNKAIAEYLHSWYKDIRVYQFPEPDFQSFHQIVVFGVKRKYDTAVHAEDRDRYHDIAVAEELPVLDAYPETVYLIPRPIIQKINYQGLFVDEDAVGKEVKRYGNVQSDDYARLFEGKELSKKHPLMPFKIGHIASLIAAGMFNNMKLVGDEETILIKGQVIKDRVVSTEDNSTDEVKRVVTISREIPTTRIVILNQNGDTEIILPEDLPTFLETWLPQLIDAVEKYYTPVYKFPNPTDNIFAQRIGQFGSLYPAQLHAACAAATRLNTHKEAFLVGEMGVGKTRIGASIFHAIEVKRGLVVVPPHLVAKWIREMKEVLPNANIMQIDNTADVDHWMSLKATKEHKQIAVLKYTSAGSASGWEHSYKHFELFTEDEQHQLKDYIAAAAKKTIDPSWELPEVDEALLPRLKQFGTWMAMMALRGVQDSHMGQKLRNHKGVMVSHQEVQKSKKMYHTTHSGRKFTEDRKKITLSKERTRHVPLYQFTRTKPSTRRFVDVSRKMTEFQYQHNNGNSKNAASVFNYNRKQSKGRWRVGDYLKDRYKGEIDLVVVDEAHMAKSDDAARAFAMHRIAVASKKILLMTGTIYGGKASTIFHLLYRTCTDIREAYTNKAETGRRRIGMNQWVDQYGMSEYRETVSTSTNATKSGNSQVSTSKKEAPGSSPEMLPWLLERTVFLSLNDLGLALPNYEEIPVPVTPTEAQQNQLQLLENCLGAEMRQRVAIGDKSLLAAYMVANLLMPDAPWRDEIITDPKLRDTDENDVICVIKGIPERRDNGKFYPKEEAMIKQIKESVSEGRGCLFLCQQTMTRNITDRWSDRLRREGLTPAVLKAGNTAGRERWINKQKKLGVNVLITHPRSIEVGLDLYDYVDILWQGTEFSVYTIMQASHRSYRVNQTKDVRVFFYYYESTMQGKALELISAKVAAAMRVNGDVVETDSLAAEAGGSIQADLERMIVNSEDVKGDSLVHDLFLKAKQMQKEVGGYVGTYQTDVPLKKEPTIIEGEFETADEFAKRKGLKIEKAAIHYRPDEALPVAVPIETKSDIDDMPPFTEEVYQEQEDRRLTFGVDKAIHKRKIDIRKAPKNPGQLNIFGDTIVGD